jgi:hypothetical protein
MAEKITNMKDRAYPFDILNAVNVNEHTETKDTGKVKLTYLSWAWAWSEVKKRFPDAQYEIIKFNGLPYVYDEKTGFMVYTTVTIDGITHEMWLPVMDGNNRAMMAQPYEVKTKYNSITVQPATMFDVNKAIMRCLTKNLAMFGLGLYIYAGEDLPEVSDEEVVKVKSTKKATAKPAETAEQAHQRAKASYKALIDYCAQKNDKGEPIHDIGAVAQMFKLHSKSTAEEFIQALESLKNADGRN